MCVDGVIELRDVRVDYMLIARSSCGTMHKQITVVESWEDSSLARWGWRGIAD